METELTRLNVDHEWLARFEAIYRGNDRTLFQVKPEMPMLLGFPIVQAGERKSAVSMFSIGKEGDKGRSVALLNVKGALLYNAEPWYEDYGYTGYNLLSNRFEALVRDDSVRTIVLRIQSPGGTAFGASEMSQMVFNARGKKKIVSYADPYAFSAAYEIGSASESFYTTKSGMVGSIGSYAMHVDVSKALEKAGVAISFIKAGEKKTDGNSYEPLSDTARADLQAEINFFYELFVSDVARNRGVSEAEVKEKFGKGGRVLAKEALAVGMIDGIISLDELLNRELTALANESSLASNKAFVRHQLALLELED